MTTTRTDPEWSQGCPMYRPTIQHTAVLDVEIRRTGDGHFRIVPLDCDTDHLNVIPPTRTALAARHWYSDDAHRAARALFPNAVIYQS